MSYPQAPASTSDETSILAAEQIDAKTLRQMVLDALRTLGPSTVHEVADYCGVMVSSIQPRFSELSKLDAIEKTSMRRQNRRTNKTAVVWRLCVSMEQVEMFPRMRSW